MLKSNRISLSLLKDLKVDAIEAKPKSVPLSILKTYELSSMTIEYRRECGKDNVLQSLTTVSDYGEGNSMALSEIECQHLLRLKNGSEVVKRRTQWRPKYANPVQIPAKVPKNPSF